MKPLSETAAFALLCKATGRWGLYISGGGDDPVEAVKAAPTLSWPEDGQCLLEHRAIFLFRTLRECDAAFEQIVGDEGPTRANPYRGAANWYALTCDTRGRLGRTNT